MLAVPFYFRIVNPRRFFRNIAYLRHRAHWRLVLNLLSLPGVGRLAVTALRLVQKVSVQKVSGTIGAGADAEVVDDFADWADDLWRQHCSHYGLCAVRDTSLLRAIYPAAKRDFIRLKVTDRGRPIGWALLLDHPLSGHKHFGDMRLGSLVDCFAAPADAFRVAACVRDWLEGRGVDLIVSNQSHRAWRRALESAGFLHGPSNFLFATSRPLSERLDRDGVALADVHINRGDGDGPIHL
jgi:hypothetical protein